MTLDSASSVPSFSVDFWHPYVPVASAGPAAGTAYPTGAPALSYSAELHVTHADFCRGEHFVQYQEQVRESLSFLVEFCRQHDTLDVQKIADNFDIFFRHRFDEYHYFDTRAEMVDAIGKRSLDEFCAMIRNEAIDKGKRTAAIRELSYGVTLCADGAVSNLVSAACTLAKAAGGIRGKLWEIKEATATHVLRQLMDQHFYLTYNYLGNEIHYVNTAWNILAAQFGLEQIPDGITMSEVAKDGELLTTCAARLSAALTPDKLSRLIAEACQARFDSRMAMNKVPSTGQWNAHTEKDCSEALEDIGNDFGLASADGLEFDSHAGTTTLRASDLRMKSFLELTEHNTHANDANDANKDDEANAANDVPETDGGTSGAETNDDACTYTYAVRKDPSLIALDVLRAMDGLKLLHEQTRPQNSGEWIDDKGVRAALFVYGELAWVARMPAGGTFEDPMWNSRNAEFDLITLPDLIQWQASHVHDGQRPPPAAMRQAIQVTAAAQLVRMPARWLKNAADLQRLLHRLGPDGARDYLKTHLPFVATMGAGFTNQERQDLLAYILRLNVGNTVRTLAERWIPHESVCVDTIHALLVREAVPALHRAMLGENPQAAVQAWYQPLAESGLLTLVAPRLADLLDTWYTTSPILSYVLGKGYAPAIAAFYALLKELLRDRSIRWHIRYELPALLAAMDCHDIPMLSKAMADGHTAAVQAFYNGLTDLLADPALALTIRPTLLEALPDLLVGKKGNGDSGLGFAVENGHTGVITAFHDVLNALLNDPNIATHIEGALPRLLAAKFVRGASALSQAMRHKGTAAIKAFYAMLTDPAIIPHLRYAMPSLLNGKDTYGKTGLSNALEHGHAHAIEAYHDLLKKLLNEPTVAPQIRRMMPHLVDIKNRDGTSGLTHAGNNGHYAAINAFFAILDDPAIAPYTGEDLSLLSGDKWKRNADVALSDPPGPTGS